MIPSTLSTSFFLSVLIGLIVSENEASTVHRSHTEWWDHTRHRADTNQRQYLSRMPQPNNERDQRSSRGHSQGQTYTPGQGHQTETVRGQTSQRQRHRSPVIQSRYHQPQGQKASQGHHAKGDNVGQGHTVSRDNVGQGHYVGRDNVAPSHHTTRDNVQRATRDNLGHANRDNVGHHSNRDNVDQSRHTRRDNVDQTHHTRDNVGQSQTNTDNVDNTAQERKRHTYVFQSQRNSKGQSSPQCSYSFVVNELDSSKCPMLLQQLQQQQQASQQNSQRSKSPHVQSDQDILSKYYENLNINKEIEVLVQRIDTMENKLLREVAKNRELENDLLELENSVKRTEKKVEYHAINITNIATVVKRGEIMQQKQMGYWKNVDTKLSGVMLDVVELHNRLDRQDSIMQQNDEAAKSIYVQSTGQQTCTGVQNATKFKDCEDLYHSGHKRSGVYYITPIYTSCPIPVYCDMETPPGGWLVIQRRIDGTESFNKTWAQYRHGFGKVGAEHWIGNDNLFLLTNQLHYALRVDLYDFYNSRVYAEYKHFKVDGERDRYMLHVGNHTGTAPDGLGNHDKVRFSTPDQDHDEWVDYHCAKEWAAGWWFNNCWFVILNGPYHNVTDVKYRGISWNDWKSEQLKRVEMKIRPAGF